MLLKGLKLYLTVGVLLALVISAMSLSVKIDSTSPVVTITSPTSNLTYVTNVDLFSLGGMVYDDIGIAGMNWTNIDTKDSGSISQVPGVSGDWNVTDILLKEGNNRIAIKAWDSAGNSNTKAIKVVLDTGNPYCTILNPTRNSQFALSSSSLNISGISSDKMGIVSVEWYNGANNAMGTATGTNSWRINALPLKAGYNELRIRAFDAAGNHGDARINVSSDTQAPAISIVSPTSNPTYSTNWNFTSLNGTASDNLAVSTIECFNAANGVMRIADGTANWSVSSMPLSIGSNVITVTAYDDANNSDHDTITVTYDPTIPVVTITTPASGTAYTSSPTMNLAGSAVDTGGVTSVEWTNDRSGTSGTATGTSSWTVTGISLVTGRNQINVTATDIAGNLGKTTLVVFYDLISPSCAIYTPTGATNYTTALGTVNLAGDASDNNALASVTWSNAATGASGTCTGTSSWSQNGITLNAGLNVITVTAHDQAGHSGTDVIRVTRDTANPTFTITSPTAAANYASKLGNITVSGVAADDVIVVNVSWTNANNGKSGYAYLNVASSTWISQGKILLDVGNNLITFTAKDSVGKTGTDTLMVVYDKTAPTIAITSPSGSMNWTNSATVNLAGTSSDNVAVASVTWISMATGLSGTCTGTTSWTQSGIVLNAGSNLIYVNSTDTAGNKATDLITVVRDSVLPVCTISSPTAAPTYLTKYDQIALSGSVTDNVRIFNGSVKWTNANTGESGTAYDLPAGWTTTSHNWQGRANINLTSGTNTITVTAKDAAGNIGTDTLTVTYDPVVPIITITSPTGSTNWTNSATVNLAGTSSDNMAVASVTWKNMATGASGAAVGTTSWSKTGIALNVGLNAIYVNATDTAGNIASSHITMKLDSTPPTCAITKPTANPTYSTNWGSLTLNGTSSDDINVTRVTWTNAASGLSGTAYLDEKLNWSVSVITLIAGVNVLTATAHDAAGNTASDTVTVTYDSTNPTCSVTSPTSNSSYLTNLSTISLSGTAFDNLALVSVNWTNTATGASGTAAGTTSWSIAGISLNVGINRITIKARDTCGNIGFDTINITRDSTKPICTITSPTSATFNATNQPTIDIGGNATDRSGVTVVTWSNSRTGESGIATLVSNWTSNGIKITNWTIFGINLDIGNDNWITVKAWDAAGNAGIDQIKMIRT